MKNKIINFLSVILLIVVSSISILYINSCSNEIAPSLYDEDKAKGIPAEITAISPTSGYGGVTLITIDGKNFSSQAENNFVYFGSVKAKVLNATETQLIVEAPVVFGDSLRVKISKTSVELYSNTKLYKLSNAVNDYYQFKSGQEPRRSIASDEFGNIYFSFIEFKSAVGVYKISPDSGLTLFAPKGGETMFSDLKYHSDGYLIGVYGKQAIFKIEEGVRPAVFVNTGDRNIKLHTFDFDEERTIWSGGIGGKIVSAKPDKSFKLFEYEDEISALRVFDGYLYAITGEDNSQNIVRFPIISADSLGTVEQYFDFSLNSEDGFIANSLTFSADGQMYITISSLATATDFFEFEPMMYVNTDRSFGTWYSGLMNSSLSRITWSTGTEIFVIKDLISYNDGSDDVIVVAPAIFKIDMERQGAPEYGRD